MDINCDLGEGESTARTRALLKSVTSANIACGGHAGDLASMRTCLRLCGELGVRPGAHPGFIDRKNFGRKALAITPKELDLLLLQQIGALALLAESEAVPLTHVKLHGALYHATEDDPALVRAFVRFMREHIPHLAIYSLAGGLVAAEAEKADVECWGEAFADRAYLLDGSLKPRSAVGAVITDLAVSTERLRSLAQHGILLAEDGTPLLVEARTICVHSDSPKAPALARALRKAAAALQ